MRTRLEGYRRFTWAIVAAHEFLGVDVVIVTGTLVLD
jgi:hypothetical protein